MSEDVLDRVRVFVMSQEPRRAIEALRLIDALAAEVRALRKDRERLDYVMEHGFPIELMIGPDELVTVESRDEIDAAMSARSGEGE